MSMKKISKLICLALALLLCASLFVGCKKPAETPEGEVTEGETLLPETIPDTGDYIVKDGKSEYKIIIPDDADQLLKTTANDVQAFLFNATGAMLPIEGDGAYAFDANAKVISIGPTTIWSGCGLTLTDDMLDTGYYMKRFGNLIVCNARDNLGAVAAAYDMLNYLIGFECYAADEIYYEKKSDVALLDFDIRFIPTVDVRYIMSKALSSDTMYNQRLKLLTSYGHGIWITFAHTTITEFLPTSAYQNAHPDWYNEAGTQVCYSNEAMRAEMVEQIKKRIERNPEGKYVMIGHEDNFDMCQCADCVAAREKLGGYGGQELDFTNKLAQEITPWVEENYPGREIKYVFFAYQTSSQPPVRWDAEQNKYVPLYDNFSIHKNTMLLYCPIEMDFSEKFNSPANDALYQQLLGWYEIFKSEGVEKNICIWTYSITSRAYMAPTNNYAYFGEHYKTMADVGVSFIMDQFYHDSRVGCFEELRLYTEAKLMYRYDLSYNQLVEDFMTNYYKEASGAMTEYYEYYRAYLQYLQDEKAFSGALTVEANDIRFWPISVCKELISILDKAMEAIEPLKETNPERYNLLRDRILKEKVTPIYLLFTHYMTSLTQAEKETYWTEINYITVKFNMTHSAEGRINIASDIETWRTQIFN